MVIISLPKWVYWTSTSEIQYADKICLFRGASLPFIIREVNGHHLLICEAYVHGFMHGRAMQMARDGELGFETIQPHSSRLLGNPLAVYVSV
jgi:hypothetical protein